NWVDFEDYKKFFGVTFDSQALHLEHKTPILLIKREYRQSNVDIIENPKLADINFFKVMDAYTAFQEIDMYLNGPLCDASKKEPWPISDVEKAVAHGFDKKWSFRKKSEQLK